MPGRVAGPVLTGTDRDRRLVERVHDLHGSLGHDVTWLARTLDDATPRLDILRDLGERLSELGADLVARADELDARSAPPSRTTAGSPKRAHGGAHWPSPTRSARTPLRCGPIFSAICGAACFPFYGTDPTGRTARHERCERCRDRLRS